LETGKPSFQWHGREHRGQAPEAAAAGRRMGIEVARLEIRSAPADIGPAMERRAFRAQALYAISEPLLTAR